MPSMPGRSKGFVLVTDPFGSVENETFTCCHCGNIVVVPHKASPDDCGGFCLRCSKMSCKTCAATGRCTPFEEKIEKQEKRDRMLRSIGV